MLSARVPSRLLLLLELRLHRFDGGSRHSDDVGNHIALDDRDVLVSSFGGVVGVNDAGPGVDHQLVRENPNELAEVLRLVLRDQVILQVIRHLVDADVPLLLAEIRNLLLVLLEVVQNVEGGDLTIERLHVVREGPSGFEPDETDGEGVHHLLQGTIPLNILVQHVACGTIRVIETLPRTRRLRNLAVLDLAGPEVLGVLLDEIAKNLVDAGLLHDLAGRIGTLHIALRPGEPIFVDRLEVGDPETVEKGGIHLVHLVLTVRVDGGEDPSARVELVPVEGTIENDLEGRLHDLRSRTVKLVEEEHNRFRTCLHVPVGRHELGDSAIDLRKTDHVTFAHLAEPPFHHRETEVGGELVNRLALSNAVITTDEDRDVGGENSGAGKKRFEVQSGILVLSFVSR